MTRPTTVWTAAVIVAALATPAANAKFDFVLMFDPAQPIAGKSVRTIMRTDIVLPEGQNMRVIAVGPWRQQSGQAVLDARLVRIGPRAFRAKLRFPYAGRWRIQVVSASGLPPNLWQLRVRASK